MRWLQSIEVDFGWWPIGLAPSLIISLSIDGVHRQLGRRDMSIGKWLLVLNCLFFFGMLPVVYFFPALAASRALATVMLVDGLVVIIPTFIWLLVRACRYGLARH